MSALPLAFASPWILMALGLLPVIWWLLRLTPPRPQTELFPPLAILARLIRQEETPSQSPWWLTLLRLLMAALIILAMAGPVWNPREATLSGEGPVALIIDDGWASAGTSATDWDRRRQTAEALVAEAAADDRTVLLIDTVDPQAPAAVPIDPDEALARLQGMEVQPLEPDHAAAARRLREAVRDFAPGSIFFLSDGLRHDGTGELGEVMAEATGQRRIVLPEAGDLVAMTGLRNDPDALIGTLVRPGGERADGEALPLDITAYDGKGLPLARARTEFAAGQASAEFRFDEPVELRNQVVRVGIDQYAQAGAVRLLDDSFRRRIVGLVSGQSADLSQPLLSPLYYISRALSPFSDIREGNDANIANAVPALIGQGVSAIVLADVGNLPEETAAALSQWVDKGGMLIRFAGPRLAAASHEQGQDTLLPVDLRAGDRSLGGALSWDTPKKVAAFEPGSPFFGIEPPNEVTVSRQVLALQEAELEEKTWAVLEDGTPLVTAARREAGWVVLFHTSSDARWSNLSISGTFVEMLRRVVNQSRSNSAAAASEDVSLPPLRLLDGKGRLGAPGPKAKPLVLREGVTPAVGIENPPGFYGTDDGFIALNLFAADDRLALLDPPQFAQGVATTAYAGKSATAFRPWLLLAAAALLALDCLAVLWIAGTLRWTGLKRRFARSASLFAVATLVSLATPAPDASAQSGGDDDIDFSAALSTRLAYVVTGEAQVDEISRAGLTGLTRFLTARTALEPGEPAGVDIASDELAFYPVLYWPIAADAPIPDARTMARVDAFMKQGGTILFDTRDQLSGPFGGSSSSPEALRLQAILSGLDIPPLEPVPTDHVLTKSFYLLNVFPGRYAGGDLWVEALPPEDALAERPARASDGVSSILITGNDLAGAWAVDADFRPMLPTVPPDPVQREMSYRVGVNIVMYVLTGNYKADQVHIPALLERLGQ